MKKLLCFGLMCILFSGKLAAQEKWSANTLSIVAGPNMFWPLPGAVLGGTEYDPRTGYGIGVDFTRQFSKEWHFKIVIRHNIWNSVSESGPLTWPSEYSTGQYVYDPTLPHSIITPYSDKANQLLAGIGWQGGSKQWRWNTDFEIGATNFTKGQSQNATRLTAGLTFGPEWVMSRHFHLFLQPGARYMLNNFAENDFPGTRFLALQLEMGVKYAF